MKILECWSDFIGFFYQNFAIFRWNSRFIFFCKNKPRYSEKKYNEQMILSKSVLLENSFWEAGVIDTAFPYMMLEDSLASALVTLNSEMLNQVVVLDKDNHLFGLLDRESILREFVPHKSFVPQKIASQDKYLSQRACEAIRATSKETLNDFSHIIRKTQTFKKEEFIFYGIRYFLSHGYYLTDDLLVITNNDMNVYGTVSGKSILTYLSKCADLDNLSQNLSLTLVSDPILSREAVICLASEPLENGLYIIDHTAAICILIKKNNKLIGFLTREIINQQTHSLYPDLLNYPMEIFMKSFIEFDVLEPDISLTKLCYHLIKSREGFVVIQTFRKRETKSQRNISRLEYEIISVKSFLDFLFKRINSY